MRLRLMHSEQTKDMFKYFLYKLHIFVFRLSNVKQEHVLQGCRIICKYLARAEKKGMEK